MNILFSQEALSKLNVILMDTPHRYAAPLISIINAEIQKSFDTAVDMNTPSGQTTPPDLYGGD